MTGMERQALTAWAACWGLAAACIAYIRHTRTPKGDR